jgi:hypothetical protein
MDQKFLDLGKIQGTCVSAQHAKKAAKSINDMVKMYMFFLKTYKEENSSKNYAIIGLKYYDI